MVFGPAGSFWLVPITLESFVDGLSIASRNPEGTATEFSTLLRAWKQMMRPGDTLNRLKDLALLSEGMRLTPLGEETQTLVSLEKSARSYFTTYKLVPDYVYHSEIRDTERIAADVLAELLRLFEQAMTGTPTDDSNCLPIGRAPFLDAAYVRGRVQQAAAASNRLYLVLGTIDAQALEEGRACPS